MSQLITGFEPFGGMSYNPSEEVAKHFRGFSLPVVRYKSFELVKEVILKKKPTVILMTGLAKESEAIRLERIAINLDDYSIPDNEGNFPREEKIIPDGPAAYFSSLPIRELYQSLHEQSIPVQVSLSAGSFLCNHLFYQVMHFLSQKQWNIPAGFIHLPDNMPKDILIRAFERILASF